MSTSTQAEAAMRDLRGLMESLLRGTDEPDFSVAHVETSSPGVVSRITFADGSVLTGSTSSRRAK